MSDIDIIQGDLFEEVNELEDESVHAIICDPPYGLAFMGKDWDDFDPKEYQNWCEKWAKKVKKILKPGGHLIAFSGSRTHHRAFTGIEDAGFEIRDCLTWHYAEGFPKSANIKNTIERYSDQDGSKWAGWTTQLKPATEFIILARKPLSEDSIYRNVLKHETGALNIDQCRVPTNNDEHKKNHPDERGDSINTNFKSGGSSNVEDGRYPSNLLLSTKATKILDERNEKNNKEKSRKTNDSFDKNEEKREEIEGYDIDGNNVLHDDKSNMTRQYGDSGGKSRFFPKFSEPRFRYESKPSKSERTQDEQVENDHPTVKPLDLMRWLVRLTTKENQTVLDPFMGSGTTGLACIKQNRNFVGIEKNEEYFEIAKNRIEHLRNNIQDETADSTSGK